jgi:hypothetical protein
MASVADAGSSRNHVVASKVATARFYVTKLLPSAHALVRQIEAGPAPVMALEPTAF